MQLRYAYDTAKVRSGKINRLSGSFESSIVSLNTYMQSALDANIRFVS